MTSPFTPVEALTPREFLKPEDAKGHLLLVRPLKYQQDGYTTEFQPNGTDVVFCDVADLDVVDEGTNQLGKVFRGNTFLQGYLKGTFKRYIGKTLIGMIYEGPRERGKKPPFMWMDLSGDQAVAARGMAWMQANQHFLVELTPTVAEPSGPPRYVPPAANATAGAAVNTLDQMRLMSQQGSSDGIPF